MTNIEYARTLCAEDFDRWVHKEFYGRCCNSSGYQKEQTKKGFCNQGSDGCKKCNIEWLNEEMKQPERASKAKQEIKTTFVPGNIQGSIFDYMK